MLKWLAIHSRSPHSTNEERVHEEQRRLEFNDGTIMKNPAATEHHGKRRILAVLTVTLTRLVYRL